MNSLINLISGFAASSTEISAKQPLGSGGFGSPSGQPESSKPSQVCLAPKTLMDSAISFFLISANCFSFSGFFNFGFKTSPRSPPVQVAIITSTPSATYLATVAAPLLASSSG